jgi:hypothetical protein
MFHSKYRNIPITKIEDRKTEARCIFFGCTVINNKSEDRKSKEYGNIYALSIKAIKEFHVTKTDG